MRLTEDLAGYTTLLSMQFAARLGDEATLFALAYELEEAAPWAARWPAPVA